MFQCRRQGQSDRVGVDIDTIHRDLGWSDDEIRLGCGMEFSSRSRSNVRTMALPFAVALNGLGTPSALLVTGSFDQGTVFHEPSRLCNADAVLSLGRLIADTDRLIDVCRRGQHQGDAGPTDLDRFNLSERGSGKAECGCGRSSSRGGQQGMGHDDRQGPAGGVHRR